MKWGHFILERSEVKHTVMSWLFSHSSGTTTRRVDGGERVLMFPLLKQSSWCSEKDSSCYVNSGSKDCRHKFKVLIKMWRLVRKYLSLQCLNIKCNGLKCFAVLSSSSVPFVNCVGQLFLAFWLWSVTTNSTNVRVIYFLAVGWNERAWISTNTTFLLQTWIYLKSQATVGTTLPVIF